MTYNREGWLLERRKYVTASDVAALLNESPYKTRAQLIMEKIGLADEFEGNEYTDIALELERPVIDLAAKRYGWPIEYNGLRLVPDPHCARHASTPDATMMTPWGLAVVQVKWTTCVAQEDCKPTTKSGAPSTATYLNGPPLGYQLQVQSEIACVDAVGGVLLVMHTTPGLKLRPYFVPRHEGAIARIRREVVRFWDEIAEGTK